jgi:glutamine synthetase type III
MSGGTSDLVLFHERPFKGVNGSGNTNNGLGSNTGINFVNGISKTPMR